MNAVKQEVEKLVQKELEALNQEYPMFHSDHEGAAFIYGEIEEANIQLNEIKNYFQNFWYLVRTCYPEQFENPDGIFKSSIKLACQAIQVAAMVQKFIDSQKDR